MARCSRLQGGGKQKMTKDELLGLILSDAKFMNEREGIAVIHTLKAGEGLAEAADPRVPPSLGEGKRQHRTGVDCYPPPTGPLSAALQAFVGRHHAAHDF